MPLIQSFPPVDGQTVQTEVLPTAGASQLNKIYQYVGTTTPQYVNGYYYKCIYNNPNYEWVNVLVQPEADPDPSVILTGTILANGWNNNAQTVTVNDFDSSTPGTIGLLNTVTGEQYVAAANAGLRVTAIANNSVTFSCEETPEIDIPFGILIPGTTVNGGGGTADYTYLDNKPQIANITLQGNKSLADLGIASASDVETALGTKVDKVAGKGLSTNDYSNEDKTIVDGISTALADKVDKVVGKGLSTNDYTDEDKAIVGGVTDALATKADIADIPAPQIQSDWNQTNSAALDFIKNKPNVSTIPQMATDPWNGIIVLDGKNIWTDGNNVYYSKGSFQYVLDKSTSTWNKHKWNGLFNSNYLDREYIWTDGDNIYYSRNSDHYVLNKTTFTWSTKTWTGLTSFSGAYTWTDGDNIYCSFGNASYNQYVLNKNTSTWSKKTWNGSIPSYGANIWTDGDNIYYSNSSTQYVLDKTTSTWSTKTWTGLTSFGANNIWTDGNNFYYSNGNDHYILDKTTSTWSTKVWDGLETFYGYNIWVDGNNIYYNQATDNYCQYVLNKTNSTWEAKSWSSKDFAIFDGKYIWYVWSDTDSKRYYFYSYYSYQYVLNEDTLTWEPKIWSNLTSFNGENVWKANNGNYIYYSEGTTHYSLNTTTLTWEPQTWNGLTSFYGIDVWENIFNRYSYYSNGSTQYCLSSDDTWTEVEWGGDGLTNFNGRDVWADEYLYHQYYSKGTKQYYLDDQGDNNWYTQTWSGMQYGFDGEYVFIQDDESDWRIFYAKNSGGGTVYELNTDNSTWESVKFYGNPPSKGNNVWRIYNTLTFGSVNSYYFSEGTRHSILYKDSWLANTEFTDEMYANCLVEVLYQLAKPFPSN